jgi:hypothetical protein
MIHQWDSAKLAQGPLLALGESSLHSMKSQVLLCDTAAAIEAFRSRASLYATTCIDSRMVKLAFTDRLDSLKTLTQTHTAQP